MLQNTDQKMFGLKSFRPLQFRWNSFSLFYFSWNSFRMLFKKWFSPCWWFLSFFYAHLWLNLKYDNLRLSRQRIILKKDRYWMLLECSSYLCIWLHEGLRSSLLNPFHFILELANNRVTQKYILANASKCVWTISNMSYMILFKFILIEEKYTN